MKATLNQELERERVKMAGVLVALEGHATGDNDCKQGNYGWSLAFEKAKELRQERDKLKEDLETERNRHRAWTDVFQTTQLTHAVCRLESAEKERDKFKAELADIKETYMSILKEEMHGDGSHCTCVPALRQEIVRLKAENDELRYKVQELSALADKAVELKQRLEKLPNRPRIVCLCGSSRFVVQMACISWALERDMGKIVLGLHLLPADYPNVAPDHMAEHEGKKDHMDELHKRKIDLADEILIVNIGGYVGDSTKSEIKYALAHNKLVKYLEP